jgi:hypothetical protein
MRLEDVAGKLLRELRDERLLKRAGRDDDLVGDDRPVVELEAEAAAIAELELLDLAVGLDR